MWSQQAKQEAKLELLANLAVFLLPCNLIAWQVVLNEALAPYDQEIQSQVNRLIETARFKLFQEKVISISFGTQQRYPTQDTINRFKADLQNLVKAGALQSFGQK